MKGSLTSRDFFKNTGANVFSDVPRVEIVSELTICFGSKATIVSVVTSTPSPEIAVWQMSKDGIHFQSMDINDVNYIESNEHPECPVLVISKATFNDKLYYRLLMWNIIGKGVSNTVYLNVTGSMIHYNHSPI